MNSRSEARHAAPRPSFDETSREVPITAEERTIGLKSKAYFDRTLKRTAPWLIKNGQIRIVRPTSSMPRNGADTPAAAPTGRGHISIDTLEHEVVSPLLGSVMFTFKRIEDKLADFSGRSYDLFRNVWGINNSYHQWSFEENQHSDALSLILERTGQLTRDVIDEDYYANLALTWEPPFPTARQMVVYAAFQEQLTSLNYQALAKRASEEDAPTVGQILTLIAQDEAYHGGGYRAFSRMYADVDLDGTIADALHVGGNFRMPAQHLMRDRGRNSVEIVRVGAFSKTLVSEETIYRVLQGLGFVPEQLARQTADDYWKSE
ncbi:MAG TPA: acyl-ACP desaturase [Chloroflexota bacterium]|nr:acyl-ACP desaturase [Chloroflexota bacterium]